jgi:hypothetical protein
MTPSITRSAPSTATNPASASTARPPARSRAASPAGCARAGSSSTAVTPTPRLRSSMPAHSASPPLLPAPTSSATRRPATLPPAARIRRACTASPNAARRIRTPSGVRSISTASASRTCRAVHTPLMGRA